MVAIDIEHFIVFAILDLYEMCMYLCRDSYQNRLFLSKNRSFRDIQFKMLLKEDRVHWQETEGPRSNGTDKLY